MGFLAFIKRLGVLLDPVVLCVLLLSVGVAGGSGYVFGSHVAGLACEAEKSSVKDAVIENARTDATADTRRAAVAEAAKQAARVASQETRAALTKELDKNEIPADCRLSDTAFRLLRQSACDANGAKDCPGGMYDTVRSGPGTASLRVEGTGGVGRGLYGFVQGVPVTAQGVRGLADENGSPAVGGSQGQGSPLNLGSQRP